MSAAVDGTDGFWGQLRPHTQARIGLGHTGDALPTRRLLELREAHALARDAVHTPLAVDELLRGLAGLGLGDPIQVTSRANGREVYVRRPDLGRLPGWTTPPAESGADIGIAVMDGLSSRALAEHGVGLVEALRDELRDRYTIAPPVLVTQARVALGDHIAQALGVSTMLVIIGERPGLSVADSLGIYLTHRPRPGLADSARNCISNIHPPDGLGYRTAAQTAARLIAGARALGESGVRLKDTGPALDAGGSPAALETV
ncbi:MAG: ethanolamine ammonia-lyase subunit EutC [Micropruina sp.]|uniref:ethanolamine ammonia-lyase subunit EutC n=1 Tax=Micropruina sp. TaxID=2737536 RepID=UPI0039E4CB21